MAAVVTGEERLRQCSYLDEFSEKVSFLRIILKDNLSYWILERRSEIHRDKSIAIFLPFTVRVRFGATT